MLEAVPGWAGNEANMYPKARRVNRSRFVQCVDPALTLAEPLPNIPANLPEPSPNQTEER